MTERFPALQDPNRLAALQATALLDTPPEAAFDRLTRLASRILHAPVALVTLVDAERQFLKSCRGLPEPWASRRETPLTHSFCQYEIETGQPLVITDARTHPLVCDNLAIRDLGVVAYLGIPLITAEGYVLGTLCVIDHQPRAWRSEERAILQDLAAAAVTEIELRIARTVAEEATRHREELLSIATHELGTPLTSLKGYLQLLVRRQRRSAELAPHARLLQQMEAAVTRLEALIANLLDVSRIQQGRLDLRLESFELTVLAQQVLARFSPIEDEEQPTALTLILDAPAPVIGIWDSDRLDQMLTNLLSNAVKYSPAGGEVQVSIRQVGAIAEVLVRDQGVGMSTEEQSTLFAPFSRGERMRTKTGGTGLGLYITRQIVEQHGGTITVASTPDRGSTFTVQLPLTPKEDTPFTAE